MQLVSVNDDTGTAHSSVSVLLCKMKAGINPEKTSLFLLHPQDGICCHPFVMPQEFI